MQTREDSILRSQNHGVLSYSVHLQDFQAFSCTSCGRCCRPWDVALEGAQRRAIEASQAYQVRVKANYVPLKVETPGVGELQDRGDGHCTFLDIDNLCQLHAEIGGRSKPLGCQLFPYQSVQTPDGMYLYLSFGCPPVVEGLDRDLAGNQRELDEALGEYSAPLNNSVEEPYLVDLTDSTAIPWAAYQHLESDLLAQFKPSRPIRSCLTLAMALLSAEKSGSLNLSYTLTPEELEFALEILKKFVGSMVSAVEDFNDDHQRTAMSTSIDRAESSYSARFELALPTLTLAEPTDEWILKTYQRYFRNAVLGKSLLKSTIVARLLTMASGFVLTSFYAEAYRQSRQLASIDLECLTDAFAITEFHHGAHSPAMAGYGIAMEETFARLV